MNEETVYKILSEELEKDLFPYFTDVGFKYTSSNEYWDYTFYAFPFNILK